MGGKSCRPVVDANDADRALKKSGRTHLKREFARLALQHKSAKDRDANKINKDVFIKYLSLTLGDGLAPMVMDRLFQVLDSNSNGTIEADEFLSAMYVIWYGTREHKMRLVFNLFDLDASGFVTKKHFKRISTALIQQPGTDRKDDEKLAKQFAPLADQLTYFTFYWFDRNKDTLLGYGEWLGYANDDDQIISLLYRMRPRGPHAPDRRKDYQRIRDGEGGLNAGAPAIVTSMTPTPPSSLPASSGITSSPSTASRSLLSGSRAAADAPPTPRTGIARPPATPPTPAPLPVATPVTPSAAAAAPSSSSAAVTPVAARSPVALPAAAASATTITTSTGATAVVPSSPSAPVVASATGPLPSAPK